jgi:hypothetical protein
MARALVVQGVGEEKVNEAVLALAKGALAHVQSAAIRSRLLAQQASCLVHLDRPADAQPPSLEALRLAVASDDPEAEMDARGRGRAGRPG